MSGAIDRRSVAVRIAGHDYKIRSDGDDDALVRIAGYVDRAMQRVRERTGTVDSLDVAVLTCLNLSREILALHEHRSGGMPDERLRMLIERVESVVGSGERADIQGTAQAAEANGGSLGEPTQRTLELPSVEALRERMPPASPAEGVESHDLAPQVRVAVGGRDRVG